MHPRCPTPLVATRISVNGPQMQIRSWGYQAVNPRQSDSIGNASKPANGPTGTASYSRPLEGPQLSTCPRSSKRQSPDNTRSANENGTWEGRTPLEFPGSLGYLDASFRSTTSPVNVRLFDLSENVTPDPNAIPPGAADDKQRSTNRSFSRRLTSSAKVAQSPFPAASAPFQAPPHWPLSDQRRGTPITSLSTCTDAGTKRATTLPVLPPWYSRPSTPATTHQD